MAVSSISGDLQVFSTCPQSKDESSDRYCSRVIEVSRWSEQFGCRGILVYTDNGLVDPWLVSQLILENTSTICPLVAIQPVYMHPYTAAKMAASFAFIHRRRIFLNMLAGGFKNDLVALNDLTPHDDRYVRTTEYTLIIKKLLTARGLATITSMRAARSSASDTSRLYTPVASRHTRADAPFFVSARTNFL